MLSYYYNMAEKSDWSTALIRLGFSASEAEVFLTLVEFGPQNGSQVAKRLGWNRASAYNALETLYARGRVLLVPGATQVYAAPEPEPYLNRLGQELGDTARQLANELQTLALPVETEAFFNVRGQKPVYDRLRTLIQGAKREILLNVSPDWADFLPWLKQAAKRGVRIIAFSFAELTPPDFVCDIYRGGFGPSDNYQRLLVVADMEAALMADGPFGSELAGTFSRNRLFTSVVAEHIHHDIYLLRIAEQLGRSPVTPEVQLGSLLEHGSV